MNRSEEDKLIDEVLTAKSLEILSKLDKEVITSQDMLCLYLISQTKQFKEREAQYRKLFGNKLNNQA